jgi:hypothetical protein
MRKPPHPAPHGQRASLRENARAVDEIFNRSARMQNSARVSAVTSLSDIPDERCAWCARPFETTRTDRHYCSIACRNAARYDEHEGWRARQREALTCQRCSAPIEGAMRRDAVYCDPCAKRARLDSGNKWRRKRAAARREAVLSALTCKRCSKPIEGAAASWRRYCDPCRRIVQMETKRRFKEKLRSQTETGPLP